MLPKCLKNLHFVEPKVVIDVGPTFLDFQVHPQFLDGQLSISETLLLKLN